MLAPSTNSGAALTGSDSALSGAGDGGQLGTISDNAEADAPSGGPSDDTQGYQEQTGSGPVLVYDAPVYAEQTSTYSAPMPSSTFAALPAGAYDRRPVADVFLPPASGRRCYQVGTVARLFNSRRGQGFVMPHGSMAMAGRAHAR
jgi:hypothetical protein